MRSYLVAAVILMCLWLTAPAFAQAAADPDTALEQLLKTLQAPAATEEARLLRTTEGYVRFIGAPPGGRFSTPAGAAKAVLGPDAAARDFIDTNSGVFGKGSLKQTFAAERVTSAGSLNYVRLQQKYSNFVVFGGQILVQMDGDNGVQCVSSDIMRDPGKLDSGEVSLSPAISTDLAKEHAASYVAGLYNVDVSGLTTYTNNSRMVFDPAVVGAQGELCTVLDVGVASTKGVAIVERVLVNVKNGAVAFTYPLVHNSKHRRIYDANSYYPSPNTIVREEGDLACGITDADNAYDYLGDTHDFYSLAHDRDSIDGQGMIMRATVRYCEPGQCPMYNAFYQMALPPEYEEWFGMMGDAMFFGEDYVTDDVVAHEMTHGVTSYTSGLIYENQSGAINEAFSDIWGEFVDLTNGRGDDSLQVRWLHGEDLPYGPNRNMKDPTMFGDPDRVGSPYYYIGSEDYGGVHRNSGVINKLCYLLTDGD
ncbi:MAG: M4 family metallopeptidase, partial [Candidatus Hydrogenedentes bacterium]|nr:M4 family metallopeptidase [Candidatus Hydrogenedentota bacterium]